MCLPHNNNNTNDCYVGKTYSMENLRYDNGMKQYLIQY